MKETDPRGKGNSRSLVLLPLALLPFGNPALFHTSRFLGFQSYTRTPSRSKSRGRRRPRTGDGALTGDRMSGTLPVKPEYCPAHEWCCGAFHRRRGALSGVIVGWWLAHPAGLSCRCPPPSPTHQNHRTLKSARPRHISASAAQHPNVPATTRT